MYDENGPGRGLRIVPSRGCLVRRGSSHTHMAEVMEGQGEAFFKACEDGDVVEVTRMLGCYDAASLVHWRNDDDVRPRVERRRSIGSPMTVTRDGVSMMVDVSLTRPYAYVCVDP